MVVLTREKQVDIILEYLQTRSAEICADNKCTEEEHKCNAFAYIGIVTAEGDYRILDVCNSDYFQGTFLPYAAISLPVGDMTVKQLIAEVEEQAYQE